MAGGSSSHPWHPLDGSLPPDDQVDQLIPKDERAQAIAEQEANQEWVEFYAPWTRPRRWSPRCRTCRSPTWPVKRMQALAEAKQVQFTKAVPRVGWSRRSPPTTSTWSSPSSSSRGSVGGAWTILAVSWLLQVPTSALSVGRRQPLAGGDLTGHVHQPPGRGSGRLS
jgi:hypothetical protein